MATVKYTYIERGDAQLYTVACLPQGEGVFPTVIVRTPYVDAEQNVADDELAEKKLAEYQIWINNGYAVVYQHCRGRGRSSGDCVPYIYEREDGLALQSWIREQPFYNGELYLLGSSYTSSVHYVTAPFAADIKGAILQVQDCERYNCNYRNGFYKIGLHGSWYVGMYKKKSIPVKNYAVESFNMLPLTEFSQTVLGERAADFDEILLHPDAKDEFWNTRYGGGEARDAVKHANIPILFTTGFYDIYAGGVFDMWKGLDEQTKAKSALIVQPYGHGGKPDGAPIVFDGGTIDERFDIVWKIRWLDYIRGKNASPVETGKVSYYQLFGEGWRTDDFAQPEKTLTFPLGEGEKTYVYNPAAPARFKGGLSCNFGSVAWQDAPNFRYDVVSVYTPEFSESVCVKGKMKAKLRVRSDCEDTCFYVRVSLAKAEGDYGLRDDINQISAFCADYKPGEEVDIEFSFDEHAFVIRKGEKLRVDISSSAFPLYVRHTNNKGLFSRQTTAKTARNTVVLSDSHLTLFVE